MKDLVNQVVSKLREEYGECEIDISKENQVLVNIENPPRVGEIDQTIYRVLEDIDSDGSVYFFTDRVSDDRAEILFASESNKPHLYAPRFGLKMGVDEQSVLGPAVRLSFDLPGEYPPEEAKRIALSSLIICRASHSGQEIEDIDQVEIYGNQVLSDELRSYADKFSEETELIDYEDEKGGIEDSSNEKNQSAFDW